MKSVRKRLTYANVMSSIAVFLVLGGATAFAASSLGKNTVGAKQLKKHAVTLAKISPSAKAALTGAAGARGATGATGATGTAGTAGAAGTKGKEGEPGPLLEFLPSGMTLRGTYSFAGHHATGYVQTTAISYQFVLSFSPQSHVIAVSGAPTTECPGTAEAPQAAPGSLCVYETRDDSGTGLLVSNEIAEGHFGTVLYSNVGVDTDYQLNGTWAVTAP
jgi:hypothetical protein